MRAPRITRWAAVAATLGAAPVLRAQGTPAAPAAAQPAAQTAPAQPPSVCGNTPNCVETNDFAAVITNFRTSDLRGYKMIDVVMHFQNKTANQLVLGYLQNSGTIIDDKGNRYIVWGANGVRGIGQVYGGSFNPQFELNPSGSGDAQFELAWYPGQQIYGFSFSFDLTIDEINSYQGNQHSLGGEFPLHFQGLANGISTGGSLALAAGATGGGAAAGGQPCNNGGAVGTATSVANATGSQTVQGATQQGANAVSTAASAVQSVASIFSKKKNPPPKPADSPCGSAGSSATGAATGAAASTATGATASAPATTATPNAAAAKTTKPPTKAAATAAPKAAAPATAPVPVSAAAKAGAKKTVTPDTTKRP